MRIHLLLPVLTLFSCQSSQHISHSSLACPIPIILQAGDNVVVTPGTPKTLPGTVVTDVSYYGPMSIFSFGSALVESAPYVSSTATRVRLSNASLRPTIPDTSLAVMVVDELQGQYIAQVNGLSPYEGNDFTGLHLRDDVDPLTGERVARTYVRTYPADPDQHVILVAGRFDEHLIGGKDLGVYYICDTIYPDQGESLLQMHHRTGWTESTDLGGGWYGVEFEILGPKGRNLTSVRIGEAAYPNYNPPVGPATPPASTDGLQYAGASYLTASVKVYEVDPINPDIGNLVAAASHSPLPWNPQTVSTPVDVKIPAQLKPKTRYRIIVSTKSDTEVRYRLHNELQAHFPFPSRDGVFEVTGAFQTNTGDYPNAASILPVHPDRYAFPWIRLDSTEAP